MSEAKGTYKTLSSAPLYLQRPAILQPVGTWLQTLYNKLLRSPSNVAAFFDLDSLPKKESPSI